MFSELRCAFTMGSILLSYAKPIVEDRLCSVGEELACYSAQAESYPLCVPMKFFLVCGAFFSFFFFFFFATLAKWSICDRDLMAFKVQNICHLAHYRKIC